MSTGDLVDIHPSELKFTFELRKQTACSMLLRNKTDQWVAFKVKTTNPKKYCVRPNTGILLPISACNVTVTMQAQKEAPADMQCKDKFLVQSVIVPAGTSSKDLPAETFNKEEGKVVEEFKLRVVYISANPPSPVPEESEEGSPPRPTGQENGYQSFSLASTVSKSVEESKEKSSEDWSLVSKLAEEKASALQQNQKLRQELELLRKEVSRNRSGGFSLMFMMLVGIISIVLGYILKR